MRRTTNTTVMIENGREYTTGLYKQFKGKSIEELLCIESSLRRTINKGRLNRKTLEEFQAKIDLIEEIIEERKQRKHL